MNRNSRPEIILKNHFISFINSIEILYTSGPWRHFGFP